MPGPPNWRVESPIVTRNSLHAVVGDLIQRHASDRDSILDVGCRDGVLRRHLPASLRYRGVDLDPSDGGDDVDQANLESGLPYGDREFSVVAALDVLEHCDDIFFAFEEIYRVAADLIVLNLPNQFHLRFRIDWVRGRLPDKYVLDPRGPVDRHRWVFSWENVERFLRFVHDRHVVDIVVYPYSQVPRRLVPRLVMWPFQRSLTLGAWSYVVVIRKPADGETNRVA